MAGSSFDRALIDQIRQACDIVDLIGSYVPLKRAGKNFKALSPFKKEKTPSFFVDPGRQMFKCFSTGHGGDVFKFVMLYENLEFPSAVRMIAQKVGIPISDRPITAEQQEQRQEREILYEIHRAVAAWWALRLRQEPDAEVARTYLQERKISMDLAREFGLGYAPNEWDATLVWAQKQNYSQELMEKAGLATRNESGRVYDRFRGRLMFPVSNESGQVVAFSGRLLDREAKAAKYVNSPETPIFSKSRILFGLEKTKREILNLRQAVICEGQIDLMRCYEKGIQNVVAPQGTALTEHHARLLKRYAEEVIVCFDADGAGQDAALRSVEVLLQEGISIRIATIPSGKDPDELLKDSPDGTPMKAILDAAPDFTRHLLQVACKQYDVTSPTGRAQASARMAEVVAKLPNPVHQRLLAHEVATRLQLPLPLFLEEVAKLGKPIVVGPTWEESTVPDAPVQTLTPAPSISGLLSLLLAQTDLIPKVQRHLNLAWLESQEGGPLLQRLLDSHANEEWQDPSEFVLLCPEAEKNYLAGLLLEPIPFPDTTTAEKMALSLMETLQRQWKQRRMAFLEQEIKSNLTPPDQILEKSKELLDLRRSGP